MGHVYPAFEYALPIWQQAVFHLRWSHGLVAAAYGLAAWLCFLNAQLTKEALGSCAMWCVAAALLCLLGGNLMLQGDVFVSHAFRAFARLQGWYGQRRELQYLVLALMALTLPGIGYLWFQRLEPNAPTGVGAVLAGLHVLVFLFGVRMVSAHGTDAVLNARMAGLSIGRLCELAGIASVMVGAWRSLRQPGAHLKPSKSGGDAHV